jgi:hypothetical protein
MKDHYKALVQNGFLSKAGVQLNDAQAMINDPFEPSFDHTIDEFIWYFDHDEKKYDFNSLYSEVDIPSFVQDAYDQGFGAEADDVIIMNSPDFVIYCSTKKAATYEAAMHDYDKNGVMPYYFCKRKIENRVYWFCLSWLIIPFFPPCLN